MLSRHRRWVIGCAAALLAAILGLVVVAWWSRDAPRRQIERLLSSRTGAEVSLGRLEIVDLRTFVLRDIEVRRYPGIDLLESVIVRSLRLEGDPREIARGRIETVEIEGLTVRLARGDAPPPLPATTTPAIGRLVIRDGELWVAAVGSETRFAFESDLGGLGTSPHGTVTATWRSGPLAPVVALASGDVRWQAIRERTGRTLDQGCPGWTIEAEIDRSGSLRAGSRPSCTLSVQLRGGAALTVPMPDWRAVVSAPDTAGRRTFEAQAAIGELGEGSASGRYDPSDATLRWTSGRARTSRLGLWLAIADALPEGVAVDGGLEVEARPAADDRLEAIARGRLETSSWRARGLQLEAGGVTVEGHASLSPRAARFDGPVRLQVRAATLGGRFGNLRVPPSLGAVALDVEGQIAQPMPTFRGRAAVRSGSLAATAEGSLELDPAVEPRVDLSWHLAERAVADVVQLATEVGWLEAGATPEVGGRLSASGRVRGPIDALRWDADLHGEDLGVPGDDVALVNGELSARLASGRSGSTIVLSSLEGLATLRADRLAAREVRVAGRGSFDALTGSGRFEADRFDLAGWASGRVAAEIVTTAEPFLRADLAVPSIDAAEALAWLEPRFGAALPGYKIEGRPSLEWTVEARRDRSWSVRGPVVLEGLQIGSDDGSRVLQGPEGRFEVEARGSTEGAIELDARGRSDGFVLLWDELFADYGALRAEVAASARLEPALTEGAGSRWSGTATLALPDGTTLSGEARGAPHQDVRWRAALRADDLERTFREQVRGPLGEAVPLVSKMNLAGSLRGEAAGEIEEGGAWSAAGALEVDGLWVVDDAGFVAVDALDLDLPFDLRTASDGGRSGERRAGRLAFERMEVAGIPVRGTSTQLETFADSLVLLEPLSVGLLGGSVTLHEFAARGLLGTERRVESEVSVEGVRLERLSDELGLLPLQGELAGSFPRVVLTPQTLKVDGGGTIEVFGGRVEIGGISGTDVLSDYPRVELSASFHDLDLAEITKTFDFGIMTGVLEGEVRDCELFRGAPLAFEARLETVPRKRVPQTITVKAINNLAILGTGGRITAFDRGFQKLIDRYHYRKLGLRAALHEDAFVLRGTAANDGKEKFLAGKLPFRIDIVNVRPGTPVSFRSMLERLRNLDVSSLRTEPP